MNDQLPILLLGSVWAGMTLLLSTFDRMRERRDVFHGFKVLADSPPEKQAQIRRHYFFEWLPLWLGSSLCLLVAFVAIIGLPGLYTHSPSVATIQRLCRAAAAIPFFALVCFVGGGGWDIYLYMLSERSAWLGKAAEEQAKVGRS